jgi:glycosyltransferase involved in cell wall biosynthesis
MNKVFDAKPLVSVIIPTYNRAHTIGNAIKSVLNQTYKNIEIIVADDCSTDASEALLSDFKGDIVKVIKTPRRSGAASARNLAIKASKGVYLAFLDSDDLWLPNKLDQHLDLYADSKKHHLISISSVKQYRTDSRSHRIRVPTNLSNWKTSVITGEWLNIGSTLVCTRDLFFEIGDFSENLDRFEDLDWLIRYFSKNNDLILINEPLAETHSAAWPLANTVAVSGIHVIQSITELLTPEERRNLKSSMEFEIAVALYFERQYLQSCLKFFKSLIYCPTKLKYYLRRGLKKFVSAKSRGENLSYKL